MLAVSIIYFDNIRPNTSFEIWLWSVLGGSGETIDYTKYSSLWNVGSNVNENSLWLLGCQFTTNSAYNFFLSVYSVKLSDEKLSFNQRNRAHHRLEHIVIMNLSTWVFIMQNLFSKRISKLNIEILFIAFYSCCCRGSISCNYTGLGVREFTMFNPNIHWREKNLRKVS